MPSLTVTSRRRVFLWAFLAVLAAGSIFTAYLAWTGPAVHAWRFPARAEAVVENFTGTTSPSSDDYRALLAYFVEGFLTYRVEGWAGADFPG